MATGRGTVHGRSSGRRAEQEDVMGSGPQTQEAHPVDIVVAARSNEAFRREVLTGEHEQVVVMTIPPGGEIGDEVHPDTDQVLAFVDGRGEAVLDGQRSA